MLYLKLLGCAAVAHVLRKRLVAYAAEALAVEDAGRGHGAKLVDAVRDLRAPRRLQLKALRRDWNLRPHEPPDPEDEPPDDEDESPDDEDEPPDDEEPDETAEIGMGQRFAPYKSASHVPSMPIHDSIRW